MNWLDRARREIRECARQPTAVTANRTLTAAMAVPHRAICENAGASFGGNGSTVIRCMPGEDGTFEGLIAWMPPVNRYRVH